MNTIESSLTELRLEVIEREKFQAPAASAWRPLALTVMVAGLLSLCAAELVSYGSRTPEEFIFLGYFFPIGIAARFLSRRGAIFVSAAACLLYLISFLPHYAVHLEEASVLNVELGGRLVMFMVAGIGLGSLRTGMVRDRERLLDAERRISDRLRLMLEVSTTASSSLRIEEVLQVLAIRIAESVEASFCRISLLDESAAFLRVVAACPADHLERLIEIGMSIPLEFLPSHQRALDSGEPVAVSPRDYDEGAAAVLAPQGAGLPEGRSSMLLFPLLVDGRAAGIVCVGETPDSSPGAPLPPAKMALVQTIVNQGAMAVGHALAHEAMEDAFAGTIRSLAEAIDAKDRSTRGHSDRVSRYAIMIGRQAGLAEESLDELRYAGYLHDIGKIGIPDSILTKPSRLSRDEWQMMKKHPILSAKILEPAPLSPRIKAAIRHHHERYDGKGYPFGLAGEAIPLEARVLAVADSYEAMTSDRHYRRALSQQQALDELEKYSGSQFDPYVVDLFLKALAGKAGTGSDRGVA